MNNLSFIVSVRYLRTFLTITFIFVFVPCTWGQPVITSFSPTSGPVGTTVTITGSNFSTTPANNIVYFGAVKANITAATATSLTVAVPVGTTYTPVAVTVNGLTGYSSRPFLVTFSGGGQINSSSFGARQDFTTDIRPNAIALSDFDGDGKIDVATANNHSNAGLASVSILRNTSSAANISFGAKQDIVTGGLTYCIASADIDGDGKHDIVSGSITSSNISVFRNTSTVGNISFAPKIDIAVTGAPFDIALGDIDGDGKTDISIVDNGVSFQGLSVFRNTGTVGTISFAPKVDFTTQLSPKSIVSADLDGDGKTDIGFTNENSNSFSIYRNTSISGSVSFATRIDFPCGSGNQPNNLAIADIDNDAKTDMIVVINNTSGGGAQLFRNTGSVGTVSFTFNTSITSGVSSNTCYRAGVNDINGDGKTDIALTVSGSSSGQSQVYQNNTSGSSFSFSSSISFLGSFAPYAIGFGDIEGDGKPDLVISEFTMEKISGYKNRSGLPGIVSFSPTTAGAGTTVTINGNNLTGVTVVTFGGIAASSFTVVNSTTITAVVGSGATGDVVVSGPLGTASMSGFQFTSAPIISSFTPASGFTGSVISISGSNFSGITSVSFGGVPASSFFVHGPTLMEATVANGASGSVSVTNLAGTGSLSGFTFLGPIITSATPNSGGVGSIITISGLNFTGAFSVNIGGAQAASFTVVNSTTITAIVAQGASSGNILVTTSYGTASFPGFHYTGPSISSFTPASGNAGSVITITGNNLTGTSSVSFGGTPASSFTVVNANTITATVLNGTTGNISLTAPLGNASIPGFTYTGPPIVNSFSPVSSGPGGPVTITGAHFTGATVVSFGGTPASSFNVVSPTTIVATVGTGSSGNVSVSTTYGTTTLPGYTFVSLPKMFSFSPSAGTVGSSVTISGENFSANPSNNTIYFGGVKATAISSTATSITSNVPPGTGFLPLSVTTNGLTTYSATPFVLTYSGGGSLNTNSFSNRVDYTTDGGKTSIAVGDLDNDGLADVVTGPGLINRIEIFKNQSTPGNLSLSPGITVPTQASPNSVALGDFNGDGKLDIAAANRFSNSVSVLMNTSAGNNITFAAQQTFNTGGGPENLYITDFDIDGKPDIFVSYGGNSSSITLFRNISNGASVAFASGISMVNFGYQLTTGDIDNDGKPDLVVTFSGANKVSIYRNTSLPGQVSIAAPIEIGWGGVPFNYQPIFATLGDLDGDGKKDIIVGNYLNFSFSIIRNTGSPGVITFAPRQDYITGHNYTRNISIGDIDGDGKPDIAIPNVDQNKVSLFRNVSNTGTITLDAPVSFSTLVGPECVSIADLDNDSKPDIIAGTRDNPKSITVWRNSFMPGLSPTITSFNPATASSGNIVTITGTNFTGTTAVSFGGVAASSFTVVNATTITAVVGTGATGIVSVTTPGGTATKSGFTFSTVTAVIDPSSVNSAELTVNPNPGDGIVLIKHPASLKGASLQFYDELGRLVKEYKVNRNNVQTEVDVSGFSPAIYYIVWRDDKRKLSRVFMVN